MGSIAAGSTPSVVHLVDDDESLRNAVARLLRAAGYTVHASASAAEFLIAPKTLGPACAVLDVRMPGLNGLELQDVLGRMEEPLPVVFLTGHGDVPMSVRAMRAGAVDFLLKPVERDALLGAVRNAIARDVERRAKGAILGDLRSRYAALTAREREVFARVVAGKLNKQIAADLGTSERTVKAHRAQVMLKMRVASVADLVRAAEQLTPTAPGSATK